MNGSRQFSWNGLDLDHAALWTAIGGAVGLVWPYAHAYLLTLGTWWPPIVAAALTGLWTAGKRYVWDNPDPKI